MKLEEFVKNTLLEITKGVAGAQEETPLFIAPGHVMGKAQIQGQQVSFDVAVTVSGGGAGGISVLGFGEIKGNAAKETVSRISFSVPVFFNAPTNTNRRDISRQDFLEPIHTKQSKK